MTLSFLKIDMRHCGYPIKGPLRGKGSSGTLGGGVRLRVGVGGGGQAVTGQEGWGEYEGK